MVDDTQAEPQRLTYMRLFQACGDLWLKELRADGLEDLQLRVVEAVCLAELHLPASEADIKMHDLVHLAFNNIPLWGECVWRSGVRWGGKQAHMGYVSICMFSQVRCSLPPCSRLKVLGERSARWPATEITLQKPFSNRAWIRRWLNG